MEAGNVPNTPELRRRIQALRAYVGLSLDDFAKRIGVGRQTLVRIENGEREAVKRMELREMANAALIPIDFFTVDFDRLPEIAQAAAGNRLEREVAELRTTVEELRGAVVKLVGAPARDEALEQAALNEGRGMTQAAADQLGTDAPSAEDAADTRGEEGASPEEAPARAAERPSSG